MALISLFLLSALAAASRAGAAERCQLLHLGDLPVTMEGTVPMINATIDGEPVRLIADSGAFFNTLGANEATRLKLKHTVYGGLLVKGVNGVVSAVVETADQFTVLDHTFKDIPFVTAPNYYSRQAAGLLGQNFLNVWETEYDLADGAIRLFKTQNCGDAALAYWAGPSMPYSVISIDPSTNTSRAIRGHVSVNGVELTAVFDTGTPRSVLSLAGAAKAGIKRSDPSLQPGGVSGGIGRRLEQTWIAPVTSFKIGDEEVKNTRLRVAEIEIDNGDMLIGADFFLSHRVLVANSQHKLYLTYNGGPVFNLEVAKDQAPAAPGAEPALAPPAETANADEPKDADGFVRRAEASAARQEYAQAIDEYTRAIALSPKDPQILYARGRTYEVDRQPKLAQADFDAALRLKPDDAIILMSRGALHLQDKDMTLARADFDAAAKLDRNLMVTIGDLYTHEGAYAEAVAEFDVWLSGLPHGQNGVTAFNDRCWARAIWNRDLDMALADCNEAVKLQPNNLSIRDSRGLVYLRLGRYDEAIRDYDFIINEQPKKAWSLYCRGVAKLKAGKVAQGQADMSAATGISPEVADRAKRFGLLDEAASVP